MQVQGIEISQKQVQIIKIMADLNSEAGGRGGLAPVPAMKLADTLGISSKAIGGVLVGLVKSGFVQSKDGQVQLTTSGQKAYSAIVLTETRDKMQESKAKAGKKAENKTSKPANATSKPPTPENTKPAPKTAKTETTQQPKPEPKKRGRPAIIKPEPECLLSSDQQQTAQQLSLPENWHIKKIETGDCRNQLCVTGTTFKLPEEIRDTLTENGLTINERFDGYKMENHRLTEARWIIRPQS